MVNEHLKQLNDKLKKGPTFVRYVGEVSDKILENRYVEGYTDFLDKHKGQIALVGGYYAVMVATELAVGQILNHPYVGSIIKNEHRIPVGSTLFPPNLNVGSGPHDVNLTRPLNACEITFLENYEKPVSHVAVAAVPPIVKAVKKGVRYIKK